MWNPNMSKLNRFILLIVVAVAHPSLAQPQPSCKTYTFAPSNNINGFKTCVDLPFLNSYLHWNYVPSNATIEIAYRHAGISSISTRWVVWALNPAGKTMIGSQCLVAYRKPDGSMEAYTSPIVSYETKLSVGDLSINVTKLSAVHDMDQTIIFATIKLPNNVTTLNHLWQDGLLSNDGTPQMHSMAGPNVRSMASLDLLSGVSITSTSNTGSSFRSSMRTIHGLLCALSWGVLMPIGALIARYMRRIPSQDPAWFYLHVGWQLSAYAIGVAGWWIGIKLVRQSPRVNYPVHRNIGIALFVLGTLQMCALLLRPKKDHKYRSYWNRYHQLVGVTVLLLSVLNINLGLNILNPIKIWKRAYWWSVTILLATDIILDVYMTCNRKSKSAKDSARQDQALILNNSFS